MKITPLGRFDQSVMGYVLGLGFYPFPQNYRINFIQISS